MRQRGRVSAVALSVVAGETEEGPEPLEHLPPAAKKVWRDTVDSLPPDWFNKDTYPLLEQYCVTVVRLRGVNEKLATMTTGTEPYFRLVYLENKLQQLICVLATKMRIAQQSTYDKSKRKAAKAKQKLWEE